MYDFIKIYPAERHWSCFCLFALMPNALMEILAGFDAHAGIFLLAMYIGMAWLSQRVCICSAFIDTTNFQKNLFNPLE